MKKLIMLIILLSVGNCLAIPVKWSNPRYWSRVKKGMSTKSVMKMLGYPNHEIYSRKSIDMSHTDITIGNTNEISRGISLSEKLLTFYYSEPTIEKGIIVLQEKGRVVFSQRNDSKYYVKSIIEPDYSKVKDIQRVVKSRLRPVKKLEGWENEKNWKKLKKYMPKKNFIKLMGNTGVRSKDGNTYTFGKAPLEGIVTFSGDRVSSWKQPFWYLLNKKLYREVTKEELKKEKELRAQRLKELRPELEQKNEDEKKQKEEGKENTEKTKKK